LVTPLADGDTLDVPGLERLLEHVLGGGVHGLFLLGTSGEGPSLGYRLRCELIDRVCEQVAGRVPVLVGISDTSAVESINLADYAADAGASAVVAAAPYYFPMTREELARHVRHLAAESPLPLLLYNMPSHTKIVFEPDTLASLIEVPKIVGIKDSSGDLDYFSQACRLAEQRPDWTVLMGPEELLAEAVSLGAHGGVCGGANLWPRLYVDLYEAASRGDTETADRLHRRVIDVCERIYTVARGGAAVTKGLKSALSCLEICSDRMAPPFRRLDDAQRTTIRRHLDALGLPLAASDRVERT